MVDTTGGIVVDPVQLRAIAGQVDAVVGILASAHDSRQSALVPNLLDWATGAEAAEAATVWGTFLGQLRTSVEGVAAGMRGAADSFSATDANAARSLAKAQ
jgi:Excreted virulence factor EspC, type VII ESX diderm